MVWCPLPSYALGRHGQKLHLLFLPLVLISRSPTHLKPWSGSYYKLKRVAKRAETHLPSWGWNVVFLSDDLFAIMRDAKGVEF